MLSPVSAVLPPEPLERVKILSRAAPANGLLENSTWPSLYSTFWPSSSWLLLLPCFIRAADDELVGIRTLSLFPLVPGLISEATAKSELSNQLSLKPAPIALADGNGL